MCFKKNNQPVRLAKKEKSNIDKILDNICLLLTIPEVWIGVVFIVMFMVMVLLAMTSQPFYYYNYKL